MLHGRHSVVVGQVCLCPLLFVVLLAPFIGVYSVDVRCAWNVYIVFGVSLLFAFIWVGAGKRFFFFESYFV